MPYKNRKDFCVHVANTKPGQDYLPEIDENLDSCAPVFSTLCSLSFICLEHWAGCEYYFDNREEKIQLYLDRNPNLPNL